MANYVYTNEAGTSRRRAKSIIINNPSANNGEPAITFVMEDRILMADGSELFIDAGNLVLPLDNDALSQDYPSINIATGVTNSHNKRNGNEIMAIIMDSLTDVFVTEGRKRDANK